MTPLTRTDKRHRGKIRPGHGRIHGRASKPGAVPCFGVARGRARSTPSRCPKALRRTAWFIATVVLVTSPRIGLRAAEPSDPGYPALGVRRLRPAAWGGFDALVRGLRARLAAAADAAETDRHAVLQQAPRIRLGLAPAGSES